jgi:hypothetical protein
VTRSETPEDGGVEKDAEMTGQPIELDGRRGMAAQKATELRRLEHGFAVEQTMLKARQDELEKYLDAAPAASWAEAVERARYLLSLFAASSEAHDPRRKRLIAGLLDDFGRLLKQSSDKPTDQQKEP